MAGRQDRGGREDRRKSGPTRKGESARVFARVLLRQSPWWDARGHYWRCGEAELLAAVVETALLDREGCAVLNYGRVEDKARDRERMQEDALEFLRDPNRLCDYLDLLGIERDWATAAIGLWLEGQRG